MTEVTLLSKKDLDGEIFKKIGRECRDTDFAGDSYIVPYWTMSPSYFNYNSSAGEFVVTGTGELGGWGSVSYGYGVRPILTTENYGEIIKSQKPFKNGINIVTYGEYPQKRSAFQEELSLAFETEKFNKMFFETSLLFFSSTIHSIGVTSIHSLSLCIYFLLLYSYSVNCCSFPSFDSGIV